MTDAQALAHGVDHDSGLAWTLLELATVATASTALAGYLTLWWLVRSRGGRPWPSWRVASWTAGTGAVAAALTGPLAEAGHASFTAHMVGHLLLGMVGPLLLVRAAPVTLLLRALPVERARVLTRLFAARPVRVVSHPVTAGVLNAGGLWLLYATQLYAAMHSSALVHAVVHLHLLLAGYLLTDALVGVDPRRHRASFALRATVLVTFMASHSILAKWLYAHPPDGVTASDGRAGAQLMYYGGDVVDVILIVLLFAGARRLGAGRPASRRRVTWVTGAQWRT